MSYQLTNHSFKHVPPTPGVHHFQNGVTKLKYLTARELNTILRVQDKSVSAQTFLSGPTSKVTLMRTVDELVWANSQMLGC